MKLGIGIRDEIVVSGEQAIAFQQSAHMKCAVF
jgi:hypothetical protein